MPEPFAPAQLTGAYRVAKTGPACRRQLAAHDITGIGRSALRVAHLRHRGRAAGREVMSIRITGAGAIGVRTEIAEADGIQALADATLGACREGGQCASW